jgi:hypothetical protein
MLDRGRIGELKAGRAWRIAPHAVDALVARTLELPLTTALPRRAPDDAPPPVQVR